jgi:hypothetical protein
MGEGKVLTFVDVKNKDALCRCQQHRERELQSTPQLFGIIVKHSTCPDAYISVLNFIMILHYFIL